MHESKVFLEGRLYAGELKSHFICIVGDDALVVCGITLMSGNIAMSPVRPVLLRLVVSFQWLRAQTIKDLPSQATPRQRNPSTALTAGGCCW